MVSKCITLNKFKGDGLISTSSDSRSESGDSTKCFPQLRPQQ